MKKVLKIIGIILLALLALVLVFIGILTLTEYKPADEEAVEIAAGNSAQESIRAGDSLRVVTWNIGYGALGDNADFFMDGGKGVRTADLQRVQENMDSMIGGLQKLDPDVIFLQKLDIQSDRSHILNYRSSYIIQKRPPLERGHFFLWPEITEVLPTENDSILFHPNVIKKYMLQGEKLCLPIK